MSLVFDEYGRPFIIVREQDKKSRKKGEEVYHTCVAVSAYSYYCSQFADLRTGAMIPRAASEHLHRRPTGDIVVRDRFLVPCSSDISENSDSSLAHTTALFL